METARVRKPATAEAEETRASRRRLLVEGLTIASYAVPVGLVYGLATRTTGFSFVETVATCMIVLAGGSQFAAVGLLAQHASWAAVVGVTALINARHLLYSAAIAPYTARRSLRERAAMAHFLTDETFALALAHFRRIGRFDARGYWAAAALIFFPWTVGSAAGYLAGTAVTDPKPLALDVLFPAAMAGLSVGMMTGRREAVAAAAAVAISIAASLVAGTAVGLVAGAVIGPLAGMLVPPRAGAADAERAVASEDRRGEEMPA